MIDEHAFIEYADVHGNYYGTTFKAVDDVSFSLITILCSPFDQICKHNKVCVLDIDIQGHRNVKKSGLFFKSIFIAPPLIDDLKSRLTTRGTETEEKIATRLMNAIGELEYGSTPGNFDVTIVNGAEVEETYKELVGVFQSWFPNLFA